jgi:hypothetical protein
LADTRPIPTNIAPKIKTKPLFLLCNQTEKANAKAVAVWIEGKAPSRGKVIVNGGSPLNSKGLEVGKKLLTIEVKIQAKTVDLMA